MILTTEGFIEFVPAAELLHGDPVSAIFKDGRRYTVISTALVGVNRIRIDGERADNNWQRPPRASLLVTADEIIPAIRRSRS